MNYNDLKEAFSRQTPGLYLYFLEKTLGVKDFNCNRIASIKDFIQTTAIEVFRCFGNPTYTNYDLVSLIRLKREKVWIDALRQLERTPKYSFKEEQFLELMGPTTETNAFETENFFEKIRTSTNASNAEWKIFELKMEGYKNREISKMMGISEISVKVKWHRLKPKIKQAMSLLK